MPISRDQYVYGFARELMMEHGGGASAIAQQRLVELQAGGHPVDETLWRDIVTALTTDGAIARVTPQVVDQAAVV
jgi:hypothetical protein